MYYEGIQGERLVVSKQNVRMALSYKKYYLHRKECAHWNRESITKPAHLKWTSSVEWEWLKLDCSFPWYFAPLTQSTYGANAIITKQSLPLEILFFFEVVS